MWNPFSFQGLAELLAQGESDIVAHTGKSRLSETAPVADVSRKRAVVGRQTGNALPEIRAENRATGRYLLRTDISRFYHSVYTHSIPWALHGKTWAKAHRDEGLGGDLDRALRNGQGGQTLGIPVGPDSSLVIAEIIGCAVDAAIQNLLPHGFRFVDDYELTFDSRADAEAGLARLEEALSGFELAINPRKTSIDPLPQPLEADWLHAIREYDFGFGNVSSKDLLRYFNLVFNLQQQRSTEPVIPYAVGRLRAESVGDGEWLLFQNLLFQCAMVEPACLPSIFAHLSRHSVLGTSPSLPIVLDRILQTHSVLGHASEVAWALWIAIWFRLDLSQESAQAVSRNDDPIVALLALHARDKGLFRGALDVTAWQSRVSRDELYDRNWLLVYEALQKQWLTVPGVGDPVAADPNFEQLKAKSVSFYDLDPSVSVAELVEVTGYALESPSDEGQPEENDEY